MRLFALLLFLGGIAHGLSGNQIPSSIFVAAGFIILAMYEVRDRKEYG